MIRPHPSNLAGPAMNGAPIVVPALDPAAPVRGNPEDAKTDPNRAEWPGGITFWEEDVELTVIEGELAFDPVDEFQGLTYQEPIAADEEILSELHDDFVRALMEEPSR